ncbi:MAG TPA: carboxyltransferase domain-containing protein [Candidatus Dormibacteraeota bacterium]|nr:carboxyltransferase domain-containing protein [Candidatus Dormibacteraeota bacterium]
MPRLLPCADSAVLVSFTGEPDAAARAAALDAQLLAAPPAGVAELVPGLESVLVLVDGSRPLRAVRAALAEMLETSRGRAPDRRADRDGHPAVLAVSFGGVDGPDLEVVAGLAGTDAGGVVALVTAAPLTVALVGHLPGLPYLVGLPADLDIPRRAAPRPAVAAGSVGIARGMACVYPVRAPAGWHVVGRTDARLCDLDRDPPFLLGRGDRVQLVAAPPRRD